MKNRQAMCFAVAGLVSISPSLGNFSSTLPAGTAARSRPPVARTFLVGLNQSFSEHGQSAYQGFSVSEDTTFDVRFTSDQTADAALIPERDLPDFVSGRVVGGYASFDNVLSTHTSLTLAPGIYFAAVRNESSGRNSMRLELDSRISSGAQDPPRHDDRSGVMHADRDRASQPLASVAGGGTHVETCNPGVVTFVIRDDEMSSFLRNRLPGSPAIAPETRVARMHDADGH